LLYRVHSSQVTRGQGQGHYFLTSRSRTVLEDPIPDRLRVSGGPQSDTLLATLT